MYKKALALFLTVTCINFVFADTPQTSSGLFKDPNKVNLDKLASTQQRIDHLEHKDHLTKAQMGASIVGLSLLSGFAAGALATGIADSDARNQVWGGIGMITALGIFAGTTVLGFTENTNSTEEEQKEAKELQQFIIQAK